MKEKEYFKEKIIEMVDKIGDCEVLTYLYRLIVSLSKG